MSQNKNIIMHQFNGTDYDNLYPATKIEQVEGLTTMAGATASAAGAAGLVPAPAAGDQNKVLSGAATWVDMQSAPNGIAQGTGTNALLFGNTTNNTATGIYSIDQGNSTTKVTAATLAKSDAEIIADWEALGDNKFSLAKGETSYSSGSNSLALGKNSHAEGNGTIASASSAHSEGTGSRATGKYSHAGGLETIASGQYSFAHGKETKATGEGSAAFGYNNQYFTGAANASGQSAFTAGTNVIASGEASAALGKSTEASGEAQIVVGQYNESISESGTLSQNAAFIVGNGIDENQQANAFTVYKDGHVAINSKYWGIDTPLTIGTRHDNCYIELKSKGNNLGYYGILADGTPVVYQNGKGNQPIVFTNNIVDNVTSTTTTAPLSANQGKLLNDRVSSLETIGRFLSLWNAATGLPTTNPTDNPYLYKTGDYFRVSVVSSATPAVNYKPNGDRYERDVASTTVESAELKIGDIYYYDGTNWSLHRTTDPSLVADVKVNGTSVVTSGIANIDITGKVNEPASEGTSGQVLTTNGSGGRSWTTVDALPSQTGQAGKFLTTDGATASWLDISSLPVVSVATGTLAAGQTTVTVNYTGTYISSYVVDGSGNKVVAEEKINASNVVFTINEALASDLTCKIVATSTSVEDANARRF